MSFKKTKIFVAVAIVVFIFAVGNIVLFGNLSKEKVVVINNQTNLTIAPVADVKKNVTKQNTTTDVVAESNAQSSNENKSFLKIFFSLMEYNKKNYMQYLHHYLSILSNILPLIREKSLCLPIHHY